MLNECEICGSENAEDAILDGEHTKLCKSCALAHNAILLSKPTAHEIANINRPLSIVQKERMMERVIFNNRVESFHEKLNKLLINKIIEERGKLNLTQAMLAEKINEPEMSVTRLEKGISQNEKVIRKIEEFFNKELKKEALEEIRKSEAESSGECPFNLRSKSVTIGDLKSIKEKEKDAKRTKEEEEILKKIKEMGIA